MTTQSSALSQGSQDGFDTGPLSWVMAEIRETLSRTRATVQQAVTQEPEARSTSLRHAKTYLHQAHGALQMVDVDGVGLITETVEDLLDCLENGKIALSEKVIEAIVSACDAVVEYLEELLAGEPHQPVRLFPYYRTLLQARGADRIHPADLFFPNLSVRPQFPASQPVPVNYREMRQKYEQLLLPFLKSDDAATERSLAAAMASLIRLVEQAQDSQQLRAFWWVLRVFAEGVAAGQIGYEVYVKQLFARINLQIRRIVSGSPAPAERLLRDGLFFIAQARNPSHDMLEIRKAWQLEGLVPPDYDYKRYGLIDMEALAAAKERVTHAKSLWGRIVAGDVSAIEEFGPEMQALIEAGSHLNSPAFADLLRKLGGIARHAARADAGENLGVEVATSLLFIENALNHPARLNEIFAEQAEALTARLLAMASGEQPAEAAPWMDDMSREAQHQQSMAALVAEMQANLGQVEKALDDYFAEPAAVNALQPVDGLLRQLQGAVAILDQEQAVRAVENIRKTVQGFLLAGAGSPPDNKQLQRLAQNVGAFSFFIDSLRQNAQRAKQQFSFNDQLGVFQANVVQKKNQEELTPTVDVSPAAAAQQSFDQASSKPSEQPLSEGSLSLSAPEPAATSGPAIDSLQPIADASASKAHAVPAQSYKPEALELSPVVPPQTIQVQTLPELELDLPEAAFPAQAESAAPAAGQNSGLDFPGSFSMDPDNTELEQHLNDWLTESDRDESLSISGLMLEDDAGTPDTPIPEAVAGNPDEGGIRSPVVNTAEPASPADMDQQGVDAELLEIFLLEAVEVLDTSRETMAAMRQQPNNQEHMATIRRCFHTLKGSGRMVGLTDFGNAAWSIEQVLNLRLSEGKGGTPELYTLMDKAIELLGSWVGDLQAHGRSNCKPDALIAAAERVRKGEPFRYEENSQPAAQQPATQGAAAAAMKSPTVAAPSAPPLFARQSAEPATRLNGAQAEELPMSGLNMYDFGMPGDNETSDEHSVPPPTDFMEAKVEAKESMVPELPPDESPHVVESADQGVMPAMAAEPVAITPLPVSNVIEFPDLVSPEPRHDDTVKRIGDLSISVPLHNIYMAETDELVRRLATDLAEWRHEASRPVNTTAVHAAHSLAGSSGTVGFGVLQELAHALEMVLLTLSRNPVPLLPNEYDVLDHVVQCIKEMLQKFALCEMPPAQPELVRWLQQWREHLVRRAERSMPETDLPDRETRQPDTGKVATAARSELQQKDGGDSESLFEHAPADTLHHAALPKDEIDEDLLQVFIEEAHDALPQIQQLLREWQLNPSDAHAPQQLLRLLHTIKGSARMAGAMALGQHMHEMEERIQQITLDGIPGKQHLDELLNHVDAGMHMFEQLAGGASMTVALSPQRPALPSGPSEDMLTIQPLVPLASRDAAGYGAGPLKPAEPAMPAVATQATTVPLVRIRSDMLDRLLNQAGEVSIARSKIETEVGTLQQSLAELTENVSRLSGHLREIEIQAESQMASQMANAVDRDFDPLEFDRFTRLQELTRIMAENVNDVASLQHNLSRAIEATVDDLAAQGRLTRDLQQDLMRVRLVQFASISERLFRVTRQAAKETGKRVNLDIRGGAVELDRSVLEKMAGPFEHLLRNSIVHGIESREARIARGKSETGEILVEVRQDGNEIVIRFADDGQGLNIDRIRTKARSVGLLSDDTKISDNEVQDLIFHPGFSTASEVTELAGRGVGLDVVRSEAAAVGGRVAVINEQGKGAQFVIRLPMTMAVTQVVLLVTGGKTYAVPSVLVEQVQQLRSNALAAVYNEGAVLWQGKRVSLHFLSALLGDASATPKAQEYSPVVILRSGDERVAVHVDEVIGSREVVLKNLGPQLARMIGIVGATVTGAGDIVLILDPVPLARRAAQEDIRAPRQLPSDAPEKMGAIAEILTTSVQVPSSQPVQGLRTQNIVMVVDDSLTVRRVTQRLLLREGYQVVLAKDGVDALEQLQAVSPDVMLVDIEMPRMDGFDLTRNVRSAPRTEHIPIIMITSRTAEKHRNYALGLGVNEYLGKPYNEEQLLQLIQNFVGRKASVS